VFLSSFTLYEFWTFETSKEVAGTFKEDHRYGFGSEKIVQIDQSLMSLESKHCHRPCLNPRIYRKFNVFVEFFDQSAPENFPVC
jgi:hypothetical protein